MQVIGQTTDGRYVVSGLGRHYFESGLPLSILFDYCIKNDVQPSFLHLYRELKQNGMQHERIIHLLHEHVFESYGKEYRDEIIERIESVIQGEGKVWL